MKVAISSLLIGSLMLSFLFSQNNSPKEKPFYIKQGQRYLSVSDLRFGLNLGTHTAGNINTATFSSYDRLSTGLKIGYGYMATDHLMIGGRIGYNGHFSRFKGDPAVGVHGWNANLYSRYYFSRGKFSPFVEMGAGIDSRLSNRFPTSIGSVYSEAKFGLQYHLTDKVSIELSNAIRYTHFSHFESGMPPPVKHQVGIFNPTLGFNFRF